MEKFECRKNEFGKAEKRFREIKKGVRALNLKFKYINKEMKKYVYVPRMRLSIIN